MAAPDPKRKKAEDDDEIDPDAAPPPQEFQAPKGLGKIKPDSAPIDVKSGAATGTPPPLVPGGSRPLPPPMPKTRAREDIDPDAAPPPKEFQAPKGLLKMKADPPADFHVKSGAGAPPVAPPPPPPMGANVRMDKPVGGPKPAMPEPHAGSFDVKMQKPESGPKPHLPLPDAGPVDVRMQKPEGGPKPHLPTAEDLGTPDIKFQKGEGGPKPAIPNVEEFGTPEIQQQKGVAKLPKMEAPGEFDVVKPHASPEPKPQEVKLPTPLDGDVEIKDYRRNATLEPDAVADPFGTHRKIGVVDTTFARFNMGDAAEQELKKLGGELDVLRRTVPGIKDLAVECKILFEKHGCDLVLACGMVGKMPIDKQCAHEASLAIQWTMLAVNKHILEVFVHEDEAGKDEKKLAWLMDQRTREHALNAWQMVFDPEALRAQAGTGQRQGFQDAGPIPLG